MRIVKRFESCIICIQNEESVIKRGRLFARLPLRAYYSYFAVKTQRSLRPSRKSGTIVAEIFVRSRLSAFFCEISLRGLSRKLPTTANPFRHCQLALFTTKNECRQHGSRGLEVRPRLFRTNKELYILYRICRAQTTYERSKLESESAAIESRASIASVLAILDKRCRKVVVIDIFLYSRAIISPAIYHRHQNNSLVATIHREMSMKHF